MKARTLLLITGVAALGAAGSIWWLRARDKALQHYEASIVQELALNRRYAARLAQSQPARPAIPLSADIATEPATNVAQPSPSPEGADARYVTILRQLPEYQLCIRARGRRAAMKSYGDWFLQLNVTPERLALIKQCIADNFAAQQDDYAAAIGAAPSTRSAEFRDRLRRMFDESTARLQQGLTADEFSSYRTFMQASSWTKHFNEIKAYFEERGVAPLGASERRAFTESCVKAQEWAQQNRDVPPGVSYRMKNEQIAASTSPALTPAQSEALAGYLRYLTQQSSLLGQVLRPDAPDSVVYTRSPLF